MLFFFIALGQSTSPKPVFKQVNKSGYLSSDVKEKAVRVCPRFKKCIIHLRNNYAPKVAISDNGLLNKLKKKKIRKKKSEMDSET